MTFTQQERTRGNAIVWSANRLQYMTNTDKLQVSSQMFDRGLMSTNMIMDIWNLPHITDGTGDKRYIRKEYIEITELDAVAKLQAELQAAQAQLAAKTTTQAPEEDNPEQPAEEEETENDH